MTARPSPGRVTEPAAGAGWRSPGTEIPAPSAGGGGGGDDSTPAARTVTDAVAAAHVTGAGRLRASRDQAAPLPRAARGPSARCSRGVARGVDVRADVRGAWALRPREAKRRPQRILRERRQRRARRPNPAPGTRPPAQPAREAPRAGAGPPPPPPRSRVDRFWGAGDGRASAARVPQRSAGRGREG